MNKALFAISLLLAFSFQTFQQAFVVAGYYISPAAFARNCENKARPQLHCNGKCQMMKKLQEEERKQQQMPLLKLQNEVISSRSFFPLTIAVPAQLSHQYPSISNSRELSGTGRTIFRPPLTAGLSYPAPAA